MEIQTSSTGPARPCPADVAALLQFLSGPVGMQHIHADAPLRERRRGSLPMSGLAAMIAAHHGPSSQSLMGGRSAGGAFYENPFDPACGARWPTSSPIKPGTGCAIGEGDYLHQRRRSSAATARGRRSGTRQTPRRALEKAGFEVVRFLPEMDRFLYRQHRQLAVRAYRP